MLSLALPSFGALAICQVVWDSCLPKNITIIGIRLNQTTISYFQKDKHIEANFTENTYNFGDFYHALPYPKTKENKI